MTQTIAEAETGICAYGSHAIDLDDAPTDSHGQRCCQDCYDDGAAYVEPLDHQLNDGGGW
jgi:phage FluMu gp28-like protein